MTKAVDDLIDSVAKPRCKAVIHRVPDEVQPILRRAFERRKAGEYIGAAALARVIQREFDFSIAEMAVNHWLKTGCPCG